MGTRGHSRGSGSGDSTILGSGGKQMRTWDSEAGSSPMSSEPCRRTETPMNLLCGLL